MLGVVTMNDFENKTLPDRLRGIYEIPVNDGLGLLDGKDTFTRDFGNQGNLQSRAASIIESLQRRDLSNVDINLINDIIDELMLPADPLGMGKTYVVPIRKEAAERIAHLWDEARPT